MGTVEDKAATPPEVVKTIQTLAPSGSPPERVAGALALTAELLTTKTSSQSSQGQISPVGRTPG